MDETKKIGLFSALLNSGKAFAENTEISDYPIEWDNLNKKDFENADVDEDIQKVLSTSLKTVKLFVEKFYESIKSGAKSVVNRLRTANIKREENINQQGREVVEEEQEISK